MLKWCTYEIPTCKSGHIITYVRIFNYHVHAYVCMHTQCYSGTMSRVHVVLCLPCTHTNTQLEPLGGVSNFVRSYMRII